MPQADTILIYVAGYRMINYFGLYFELAKTYVRKFAISATVVFCINSAAFHVTAVVMFRVKLKLGGASSLHASFYLAIAAASIGFLVGALMIVVVARLRAKVNSEQSK